MNKIEKLHLKIINSEIDDDEEIHLNNIHLKSAEITKNIAIKFVEYLTDENSKYAIIYGGNPERLSTIDKDYTIEEVFEEFLKTL